MTISKFREERRRHPRIENNIPVKITSEKGDVVTETWNLSRTGVYCKANRYIEPMTKLKISLLLPIKKDKKTVTKKVSCQGVVVRTEPVQGANCYNTAVFFNDIHLKDADYISDFIHQELGRL